MRSRAADNGLAARADIITGWALSWVRVGSDLPIQLTCDNLAFVTCQSPRPPFLMREILTNHVYPASALLHTSLRNIPSRVCTMAHFNCWKAYSLTAFTAFLPLDYLFSLEIKMSTSNVVIIVGYSQTDCTSDRPKLALVICGCQIWSKHIRLHCIDQTRSMLKSSTHYIVPFYSCVFKKIACVIMSKRIGCCREPTW